MEYLLLVFVTLILGFATQAYINSSYKKYSRIANDTGMTGAQVARRMLDDNGLSDVPVQCVSGTLTDHYDPRNRVVSLSTDIYSRASVAATAVACHECGHAVQHARGYLPMKARTALVPLASFSSSTWLILLFIGIFLNITGLITAAIVLYAFAVLFHIVTLPVEFDASKRGLAYVRAGAGTGMQLSDTTVNGATTVLRAAALTYVAAALTSVMQLLYYMSVFGGRR